ncbi:redoxin domain-containing protein [Portibacter lacus]|uniref:Thioredoxin domain-containing protein n=1 Tax=Portibacter lacus TaxID=1099794 RepID=A0AA37WEF6_9BACT|nr:redoxin domain-containing protein [Portibacter lacus]GLR17262.1 hypothetical protein GCM10007940_18770 [Portibacter lacus]
MKRNLTVGDSAPPIQNIDIWDEEVKVPASDKWTYLSFHRFAACPFCNLRINQLRHQYEEFKKRNIRIIAVWPSDKDLLLHNADGAKMPFPMLSNANKQIYKDYGVTESSLMGAARLFLHPFLILKAIKNKVEKITVDADPNLMPASFLIDQEGRIKMAYYGKHFGDHPEIETIFSFLK